MGFLNTLFEAVTKLFCGDQQQQQQQPQQHPNKPHYSPPTQQQQYPPQKPHKQHQRRPSNAQAHSNGQVQPKPQSPPPKQQHAQQSQSERPQPPQHHRSDLNQINQHDEHYMGLRSRANQEGDQMARCFDESHQAYANKDGARAKELSNQGKEHKRKMEQLNTQASDWIFEKNNEDSGPGEIDLHGLYVKEAITYTDRAIEDAKRRGDTHINLIVGKGLHSSGGIAKLKPAIEELIQKHQLLAELDPDNAGVLIVQLNGRSSGRGPVIGADEVSRRLERGDSEGGCVIM